MTLFGRKKIFGLGGGGGDLAKTLGRLTLCKNEPMFLNGPTIIPLNRNRGLFSFTIILFLTDSFNDL